MYHTSAIVNRIISKRSLAAQPYLDGGRARGVVHEGQLAEGIAGFESAEGLFVVHPRDENLETPKGPGGIQSKKAESEEFLCTICGFSNHALTKTGLRCGGEVYNVLLRLGERPNLLAAML